jgi:prefoldin subunit 5
MGTGEIAAIGLAIIIAVAAFGYGWYANNTTNARLSSQSAELGSSLNSLQTSVNSLQGTISSLQGSIAQSQQAQSASAQQITTMQGSLQSLQGSLQSLQGKLTSLSSDLNSTKTSNSASLQQVSSQLSSINSTIQTLSKQLAGLTPQVPLSTLVIVGDTYNSATYTFQFTVHNTQTFIVYAQLSATLWGTSCTFNNNQGSYLSQVYTFNPLSNTVTTLNMTLAAYQGSEFCGHTQVVDLTMSYIAASSTSVSQTYTFNVIPYYTWP